MASNDVVQLEYPVHCQIRPGMYVGSVENSNVLLREICDNSIDELYSGKSGESPCDTIWIFSDGTTYSVADNCRGIPTKESSKRGWTMARLAVGSLNAGSKFEKTGIAVGQNGVGSAVVNALSSQFSVYSRMKLQDVSKLPKQLREKCPEVTDDLYYYCKFEKGHLKGEGFDTVSSEKYGQYPSTITTFTPDTNIMKSARAKLPDSLPFVNYILSKLGRETHIIVNGKEYKDSISSLGMDLDTKIITREEGALNPDVRFLISMGFMEKLEPTEIIGSVNGLNCKEGMHIRWVKNSFKKAFTEMFSDCGDASLMGVRICVVALCNEPAFSSQTKERLADIDGFSSSRQYEIDSLAKSFKALMKKNFDAFKNHELKILEYLKSTEKIGRKEFIKSTVLIASNSARSDALVPEKLIDCSTTNRYDAELFLCEGNSASDGLRQCRDPKIHAILGLRGKVLNTAGLEIEKVLSNREMKDLISAIGVGVNDYHDLSEVRYGKVIIVADADPDGLNIAALCLGAFATHLTFLVEAGYVYVARTPLFHQGEKYYLDDTDLDKSRPFERFKGLGECNPEDLEPFVFNKKSRRLIKITMDNWEDAREMLLSASAKRDVMISRRILSEKLVDISE